MKKNSDFTILIAARNAAATIERAMRSALAETSCRVILIDDQCTDETVPLAVSCAGRKLRVLKTTAPGGIPVARQVGLDAIETKYAAWLDADDEWIAGRACRLKSALAGGAEVATESIALHDGITGLTLGRLTIPSFLKLHGGWVRLFERNYLPGDTQMAFQTQSFRAAGGYDQAVFGAESFDLLLRALRSGARLALGEGTGYRMYSYPGSVSRNLKRQRAALEVALRKHSYNDVEILYRKFGFSDRITAWGLVSFALFCNDSETALAYLKRACSSKAFQAHVLEPDGPCHLPEGWRQSFYYGTILLLLERHTKEAVEALIDAEMQQPTAEGCNNLGVALARIGKTKRARHCFSEALKRFPGYLDAQLNCASEKPKAITSHQLRSHPARLSYPRSRLQGKQYFFYG